MMDNSLKEKKQGTSEAEEADVPLIGAAGTEAVNSAATCPAGITRTELKHYLFQKQAGAKVDERVRQHVEQNPCGACLKRIAELKATEPFLYGEERLPVPDVEVVDESKSGKNKQILAEISEQMAAILASPTEPFTLDFLSHLNKKVRITTNPAMRHRIAAEVAGTCEARWRRLNPEIKPKMETAAAKLMTLISKHQFAGKGEATLEDLGLITDQGRVFLHYMMTNAWFLHPDGESVWELAPVQAAGAGRSFYLRLPVLKQAAERATGIAPAPNVTVTPANV
jgi:hypothetical protein